MDELDNMGKPFHEFKDKNKPPSTIKAYILYKDPSLQNMEELDLVPIQFNDERYLQEGPISARVEVNDYDEDEQRQHEHAKVLIKGKGYALGKINNKNYRDYYQFHQVNVWAVVNKTLSWLEEPSLLGRPVPWSSGRGRLVIMPHAGQGENAYYDRHSGALRFLYAGDKESRVYTCLSHGIITHELGHAVLDGLKPGYDEVSSAETAGFHEFFGDALALASSLNFRENRVTAAGDAPDTLEAADFLAKIGQELGMMISRGKKNWIRRWDEKWTLTELRNNNNQNEHDLSQVLSNIFFEFLCFLYQLKLKTTSQREKKKDGGIAIKAFINAAKQATRTMLCAIDYCPPVNISFLQYAQAVMRADQVAFPQDEQGVRKKLAELFNSRGIGTPEDMLSSPRLALFNRDLYIYDIDRLSANSEEAYRFLDENRTPLKIPIYANIKVIRRYQTRKKAGNGYFPPREIVLEFVWVEKLTIPDKEGFGEFVGKEVSLSCGGTLVFDNNGNVLHYVLVDAREERKNQYLDYLSYLIDNTQISIEDISEAPIRAIVVENNLQLQRNPKFRHHYSPPPTN